MDTMNIHRTCVNCGEPFQITPGEAEWLREKNYDLPKRCPDCRAKNRAKKREMENSGYE
jgi:DNA-directed RNA polymerase subunit RPC12/RpoP